MAQRVIPGVEPYTPPHHTYMISFIAGNSLRWVDEDKFTFLWDNEVVIVHYNRDYKTYHIASNHTNLKLENVTKWLNEHITRIENEEDRD